MTEDEQKATTESAATDPSPAAPPAGWDRSELDFEHPAEESGGASAEPAVPNWNLGQVGEERRDHTHSPDATPEELAETRGGLSGGGVNPGGGERFGETDEKK